MVIEIPSPDEEDLAATNTEELKEPPFGTLEYIQFWSQFEGLLPSPIPISITGATVYEAPDLKWYNFEIYPQKVKLANTGFTVIIGAKWRTERPYLEGGPLQEKHVLSQIHFHWGPNLMGGSDHIVDNRGYPGEMQVTFFKSDYLTQEEAFQHPDGVMMFCYIIKPSEDRDQRLDWVLEGFPRIQEAKTTTRIGPLPMSRLMPMFSEDYFLYWGGLTTKKGDIFKVRWVIPRTTLYASNDQLKEFRKLWNPWDEPNLGNNRPIQEREDRHIFLIRPHWNQYNSLLPIPIEPEPSISEMSPAYQNNPWMLPLQNKIEEEELLDGQETINTEKDTDTEKDLDTVVESFENLK